jgi:YHS domain-containing protein
LIFTATMPEKPIPVPEVQPPDPGLTLVCGRSMTIPPENYYRAEYQGRSIYFCTEFCLEAFRADPDRFYAAHSRKKDKRVST